MKIAFTSKGNKWDSMIDPRFGRTDYLLIYDEDTQEISSFDNREIENEAHGAGSKNSSKII